MNNANSEYAKALFSLSLEQNQLDEYASCLETIKTVIAENEGYLEYLFSPAEPLSDRLGAIESAFNAMPEFIVSFLKLLCENGRIRELPGHIDEFFDLKRIHENSIIADVYSAIELSDEQKQKLETKLNSIYSKNIIAVYTVDKTLLGGIKIEIDGKTLDGSTAKKLSLIKGAMNG